MMMIHNESWYTLFKYIYTCVYIYIDGYIKAISDMYWIMGMVQGSEGCLSSKKKGRNYWC